MDQNDTEPDRGDPPLRTCVRLEEKEGVRAKTIYLSISCRHCDDAACIKACPAGCIYRDEDTGFVAVDADLCKGCRRCLSACPNDIPAFNRSEEAKIDGLLTG
jgi:Fe-S-cluster-containing dehydrogenase component